MKTGLVLEGGGLRGMFTCGVIDEMMREGINFDGLVGVSAGAMFGCNYKSKQIGRGLRYNIRFKDDPEYISFRSLLKTGNIMGTDFCFRRLPEELDVFDYETYKNNPMEFHVVCTDANTGKPVYKRLDTLDRHEIEWLQASGSLPVVSQIVKVDGYEMLDGGISDSIPLKYFQDLGFERNIVVLTQPKGFKKKRTSAMPVIKMALHKYPAVVEGLGNRHLMYNNELEYLSEQEATGNTLIISPEETLPIGRIEMNEKKMRTVYEMGRKALRDKLEEIKTFLAKQ